MRDHQISVRAIKVPKGYFTMTEEELRKFRIASMFPSSQGAKLLGVYADANNFYEAFCAAYNETVLEIKRLGELVELSEEEKELFTEDIEVNVVINFSELLNPHLSTSKTFSSISKNIYEALTNAFNDVLYEAQKLVDLPSHGRKEHTIQRPDRLLGGKETVLDFVFVNNENLTGPNITIPDGYLHIAGNALRGREDIVSVTLPDSITQIRHGALRNCINLKSINLPDSLCHIGNGAFEGCKSLTHIEIPDGVTAICAFQGCSNLQSISLPKGKTEICGQAFGFCKSLKDLTLPSGIKRVDAGAFIGCTGLENIYVEAENAAYADVEGVLYNKDRTVLIRYPEGKTQNSFDIPESVKEIGRDAFSGCKHLEAISIPSGLTDISTSAFSVWSSYASKGERPEYVQEHDGIASFAVDGQNNTYSDIDGVLFSKDKTVLIKYPKGRSQSDYTIPDGVTEIEYRAFEDCAAIRAITLPATITEIKPFAFSGCSRLERVNIPENTRSVGRGCFWNCAALADIVVSAEDAVFDNSTFEDTAWYACQPGGLIYVGNTVYGYKGEMPESTVLRIRDGAKRIAPMAFLNFNNLMGVTIPVSVIEIGRSAFADCRNLSDVTLMNSGVQIAEGAFLHTAYERGKGRDLLGT